MPTGAQECQENVSASELPSTLLMGVCCVLYTSFRRQSGSILSKHRPSNCILGIYPTHELECAEGNV